MNNSIIHRGEIVEKAARRSGASLTKLAKKLGIGRNTLYNRFRDANLNYHFIMEVGKAIYYDFTLDFPEMKAELGLTSANPISQHREELLEKDKTTEFLRLESKYTHLLEKYNKLLEMVLMAINVHGLHDLRQELGRIIEKRTPQNKDF